ncbi:MAG: hypothetical protein ACOH2F_03580 [Cellulomonas sp.]
MSARTQLATELAAALPTFRVMGFNDTLDAVTKPTVMVWQSSLARLDQINHDRLRVTLDLWVLTGRDNPEKADDDLDASLEEVIAALQPLAWVDWTNATRGIFLEHFHGYNVTVTAVAQIGA